MSALLTYGAELALFNQFAETLEKAIRAHCAAKGDETALLAMRAVSDMIAVVELAESREIRDRAREEVELALETMKDAGAKPTHPPIWLPEVA